MTLKQFWTQERDLYDGKKKAVTKALAALQQDLDKAKNADKTKGDPEDGLNKTQEALAALGAKVAEKQAALAKTTGPDAEALVMEIRDLQIAQRGKQGQILDLQETIDSLQAGIDTQSHVLERVTARLADSEAKKKSADDAEKRRDKLKERVTTAPLKDVPGQANAAKTGADHNNAETRVKELPTELRALAEKRFNLRTARIETAAVQSRAAEDELVKQREAWGGEWKAEQERTDFLRAEQAVQEFASAIQSEYDRAVNLFKSIAAAKLLSTAETAKIPATAGRTAAAGNADAVNAAQVAVDAAALDVDTIEFDKWAADADADLSGDAAVTAKKATLATARATLKDDSTVNYPDKQVTDEWEAIVTDRSWKSVVDFHDANATLARLAGLSGAALATDMDNKEAAYVTALADIAKARRRLEFVEDTVAQRSTRLADLSAARGLRLTSAVRGDSF